MVLYRQEEDFMVGLIIGIVVGAIVLLGIILACWAISTYNKFVKMKNQIEEAFSSMDVYLKKRYDLIPNLVETVKGYAKHEKEALTSIIEARNAAMTAVNLQDRMDKENALTGTLKTLFALNEQYPQLKADTHFSSLMNDLRGVEDEITSSRKYYNGCVRQYNTKREVFPSSIIANWKKFEKKPLFEVDAPEERKNVKVQF
jgi:LemA protein